MIEINNEKSQPVSSRYIEKRVKAFWDDFQDRCLHFLLESLLALAIAYLYFHYLRQLSINEIISLNNDTSFPFINLKVSLTNNHTIMTDINYIKKSEIISQKFIINKTEIDLKSELNIKNLLLEDEDEDELTIYFGYNEGFKFNEEIIELQNEIYSFNMHENDFKVKKQTRKKKFFVDEEFYFSSMKKEPRIFEYYVRSHSIKTLEKLITFQL